MTPQNIADILRACFVRPGHYGIRDCEIEYHTNCLPDAVDLLLLVFYPKKSRGCRVFQGVIRFTQEEFPNTPHGIFDLVRSRILDEVDKIGELASIGKANELDWRPNEAIPEDYHA